MNLIVRGAVVITGAGSGIGRAAALAVAGTGAAVVALDLDPVAAERVAEDALTAGAPAAVGLPCDVRDEDSVAAAVARGSERTGPVRGLVTSAGIDRGGATDDLGLGAWQDVVQTNLTGTFLACKHVLRAMLRHGEGGSIVAVSSAVAEVGLPGGNAAYCASKSAVVGFVRCVALDYAAQGIRANAILPGATETPLMWQRTPADEIPAARAAVAERLPAGRLADTEEVAAGIVWLLSDQSSYVTGSRLVVDGGLLARASIDS